MTKPKSPSRSEISKVRTRRFVKELMAGKCMRKAAVAAGYPQSMADKPGAKIMPSAREQFRAILEKTIPLSKIATRLREGLDATETKLSQHEGEFTDERVLVNHGERRQAVELAARLMELDPTEKIELDAGGAIEVVIREIGKSKPEQTPGP